MSRYELEKHWKKAVFWAQVGDWLFALALAGIVPVALSVINKLEHMPW